MKGGGNIHLRAERHRGSRAGAQRFGPGQRPAARALARHQPQQIRTQRQGGRQREGIGQIALDQLQLQLADWRAGQRAICGDFTKVGHDVDGGGAVVDAAADAGDMRGAKRAQLGPAQQGGESIARGGGPQCRIGCGGPGGLVAGGAGQGRRRGRGKRHVPFVPVDGRRLRGDELQRLFAAGGAGAFPAFFADAQRGTGRVQARIGGVEIGGDQMLADFGAIGGGKTRVGQQGGEGCGRGGQLDLGFGAHATGFAFSLAPWCFGAWGGVCHKAGAVPIAAVPVDAARAAACGGAAQALEEGYVRRYLG